MLGGNELLDLITTWLPPGGQVLDVGCGSGRMLRILAERGISGLGIDPYASDAEHCRRLRAEEMDQPAESFDARICVGRVWSSWASCCPPNRNPGPRGARCGASEGVDVALARHRRRRSGGDDALL
jgi:SAM-dependent methyltransferase